MSIVYRLDGALLPFQTVRLQGNDGTTNTFPAAADMGQPAIAGIRIEDPSGTLDIDGWHTFTVEETACSKPRIFTGWVIGRTLSRGPYRTGAGRVWECDIIDQNALFGFEVFRSSAESKRPAETDVARVQACITSSVMSGTPIHDNGRFSTANPINQGAGTFTGQTPAEMIGSAVSNAGKNFYAYWDDSARQISLHYDLIGTGPAAGISISNVASDVTSGSGGTCYPPLIDAQMESDPSRIATGVLLHYRNGYVYDRNQTLIDAMSPTEFSPSEWRRDFAYDSDRIGSPATASTYMHIELARRATEEVNLTCTVQVQARDVNLVNAGDVVSVRFSHLPGFTTPTNVFVKARTVEPVDGHDSLYNVNLQLSAVATARGPGGGGVGGLPGPNCKPALQQKVDVVDITGTLAVSSLSLDATPVPDNLLVCWIIIRDVTSTPQQTLVPDGFTAVGTGWQRDPATTGTKTMGSRFFYRFVQEGDSADITFTRTGSSQFAYVHVSEWNGLDQFDGLVTWTSQEQQTTDPFIMADNGTTALANRSSLIIAGFQPSLNVNDPWYPRPANISGLELDVSGYGGTLTNENKSYLMYGTAAPTTTPQVRYLTMKDTPAGGILRGFAALTVQFSGTCADNPSDVGQPVTNEPPPTTGGGASSFTTGEPYAAGSLKVHVDGIKQVVIETDPSTGAYDLYFDPRASEFVDVEYQAG